MSPSGLGNEHINLTTVHALTRAKVEEARAASAGEGARHRSDGGAWPSAGTAVRAILLSFGAIVVLGWVLTALNAGA